MRALHYHRAAHRLEELAVKVARTAFLLVFTIGLLSACSSQHGWGGKASQQQKRADRLADEYLDCIGLLIKKTAREKYADHITRRNVVLDSCQSSITPFTIVQEEAINDACLNSGKSSSVCDNEAVMKAHRDTEKLKQEARRRIDAAPVIYF